MGAISGGFSHKIGILENAGLLKNSTGRVEELINERTFIFNVIIEKKMVEDWIYLVIIYALRGGREGGVVGKGGWSERWGRVLLEKYCMPIRRVVYK